MKNKKRKRENPMLKKTTDELLGELLSSNNIEQYIKENEEYFIDLSVSEFLSEYISKKGLKKSTVINNAEISEIFGFQVMSGKRRPSRNTLLSLCIAAKMNVEETQATLKIAGYAPLYPKNKRDSIILLAISGGKNVCDINNELFDLDEETL